MKHIVIEPIQLWDNKNNVFEYTPKIEFDIEHSLRTIHEWEQEHHKPFLSSDKTVEEELDYIKKMVKTPGIPDYIFRILPEKNLIEIRDYINDRHTATWFRKTNERPNREIITAELVYYWMITFNIPQEFASWHFNTLLTLIRVCSEKNKPNKKMSKSEMYSRNDAINMMRRAKHHSKG